MSDQKDVNISVPKMLIMGVGSSGVRAVSAMCRRKPELSAVAVDTDPTVLNESGMDRMIRIGEKVTSGMSSGGSHEAGRQAVELDFVGIRRQLVDVNLLVIVAGLGGGTASGAVPVISRIAHESGALVLCMATLPFDFEGQEKVRIAEDALRLIRTHADAIVRIKNSLLIGKSESDLSVEAAFSRGYDLMADGVFSLWQLLSEPGICGLDYASIQTLVNHCDGFCHFASTEAEGADRANQVATGIVGHPLMRNCLSGAQGAVVGVRGGPDLRLSEVESVMDQIRKDMSDSVWLNFGVVVDSEFEGRLSVMVLVVEEWKEPLVRSEERKTVLRDGTIQGELQLEMAGKGDFDGMEATIRNAQNLDVPTYQRRAIKLQR